MKRDLNGRKNVLGKQTLHKKYPANIINLLKSVIAYLFQLVVS